MLPSPSALRMALLNRAWIQWVALGVDVAWEQDDAVVDPEALIAVTAELGDTDARLRDVSTDWCVAYGRYANGSRLKQVVRELGTPPEAIGEYVATVAAAGGPTWPMGTQPRLDYMGRARHGSTRPAPQHVCASVCEPHSVSMPGLTLLAALLATPRTGRSVADLARVTRSTKPNVASALDALILAGLVDAQAVGNERRVTLTVRGAILPGLRPPIYQPDWVTRFGVVLEVLRFIERGEMSAAVQAIEARRAIEPLIDGIKSEGLPMPNLEAFGEPFGMAFERWVVDLVVWLRSPSS